MVLKIVSVALMLLLETVVITDSSTMVMIHSNSDLQQDIILQNNGHVDSEVRTRKMSIIKLYNRI